MHSRFVFLLALLLLAAPLAFAQETDSTARDATRAKLSALLETAGSRDDVDVEFHQSTKQPYNFTGSMETGLNNTDSLEIVFRVTSNDTVNLRVYPHYKKGYINLGKLKDQLGFARKLLQYNDDNFLFWGADETKDVFCGFTVTLESGFPEEALTVVVRSIRATDRFVGELRPFIDGSASATPPEK